MLKSELLRAIQEIQRTIFSTFVDEPPSVARGGGGVVSRCPACKKKFGAMPQFMEHLANDVMPALFARLMGGMTQQRLALGSLQFLVAVVERTSFPGSRVPDSAS